jgi:hypothetical protein
VRKERGSASVSDSEFAQALKEDYGVTLPIFDPQAKRKPFGV